MSKLSFRARALDATKPLPVFRCEDLPDLHEYASINRAVPQMPTGMEKEEESVCFFLLTIFFFIYMIFFFFFFLLRKLSQNGCHFFFIRRNTTDLCCKRCVRATEVIVRGKHACIVSLSGKFVPVWSGLFVREVVF